MNKSKRLSRFSIIGIIGVVILVLALGASAVLADTSPQLATDSNPLNGPGPHGAGGPGPRGFDGRGGPQIDQQALLAEALGISVDELQAAQDSARQAGIKQAVDEGLITQAQADRMLAGDRFGGKGLGMPGMFGRDGSEIDQQALLAEALGISVDELQAAQDSARQAGMQQALDDGLITQEQFDLMTAHAAVRDVVTKAMQEARTTAIEQAVTDGLITQAQADLLLENNGPGFRGDFSRMGRPGDFGRMGRPGGFGR